MRLILLPCLAAVALCKYDFESYCNASGLNRLEAKTTPELNAIIKDVNSSVAGSLGKTVKASGFVAKHAFLMLKEKLSQKLRGQTPDAEAEDQYVDNLEKQLEEKMAGVPESLDCGFDVKNLCNEIIQNRENVKTGKPVVHDKELTFSSNYETYDSYMERELTYRVAERQAELKGVKAREQ